MKLKEAIQQIREIEKSMYLEYGFICNIPGHPNQWMCQGMNATIYLEWSQFKGQNSNGQHWVTDAFAPYSTVQVSVDSRYTMNELAQFGLRMTELGNNMEEMSQTVRLCSQDLRLLNQGITLRQSILAKDLTFMEEEIPIFESGLDKARLMTKLLEHETKGDLVFYRPSGALGDKPQVYPEGRFNLHVKWEQIDNGWTPKFEASNHLVDYRGDQYMLIDMVKQFEHMAGILDIFDQLNLSLTDEQMEIWCEELDKGILPEQSESEPEQTI